MTCSKCGMEIATLADLAQRHMCKRCSRAYFAAYRARGAMRDNHRDEVKVTKISSGCGRWRDCMTCPYDDCVEGR